MAWFDLSDFGDPVVASDDVRGKDRVNDRLVLEGVNPNDLAVVQGRA